MLFRSRKKVLAAHPLLTDMALLSKAPPPNPWRRRLADARPVSIEAGQNLSYATRTLVVKAGEPLKLTFINPDVVPHNWLLLKEGALQRVGELVNRMVADPEAASRQYVPRSDDVLAWVDVTPAGQQFIIFLHAPKKPGR